MPSQGQNPWQGRIFLSGYHLGLQLRIRETWERQVPPGLAGVCFGPRTGASCLPGHPCPSVLSEAGEGHPSRVSSAHEDTEWAVGTCTGFRTQPSASWEVNMSSVPFCTRKWRMHRPQEWGCPWGLCAVTRKGVGLVAVLDLPFPALQCSAAPGLWGLACSFPGRGLRGFQEAEVMQVQPLGAWGLACSSGRGLQGSRRER